MRKILIATTSEAASADLSNALSQYEVHICNTGAEALAALETLQPDILILDLMLPIIDGLTVLQRSGFRTPIILARTPIISENILHRAASLGVQDIVLIPCTTRHILIRLEALMEKAPSPEA